MATVLYALLCEDSTVDQSGKPSFIGVIDWIETEGFPSRHPLMCLVVQFHGTPNELINATVEIERPNGTMLTERTGTVNANQHGRTLLTIRYTDLVFPEVGRYIFKIKSAAQTLATVSLQLLLVPAGGRAPAAPQAVH